LTQAPRIAIVGAGLGGLTAAAAMRRHGLDVTVYEQAPALGEIGAGVQLGPNAMKVMRALGLEREIVDVAVEPGSHTLRSWKSGRTLFRTPMKGIFHSRFGAGYYQVHRADLHAILQAAVPPESFRLNAKCTGVRREGNGVVLSFADGGAVECDAVIGADGIHSAVRQSLFGPASPRFTGNICWRGVVPAAALPPGLIAKDVNVWLGPKGHIVHYYVRRGEMVNFVAVYEEDSWRGESWTTVADRSELVATFSGWHDSLLQLFSRAERVNKWALHDRDPLPRWSDGPVTILGDAAHPMLPYLAQGACMAVEDGYALARLLAAPGAAADIAGAFRTYEAIRLPRASRVQLGARARAPVNHVSTPLARLVRDMKFAWRRVFDRNGTSYQIDWVYAYDVTQAALEPAPSLR
jgi:salicylate hydroxylase